MGCATCREFDPAMDPLRARRLDGPGFSATSRGDPFRVRIPVSDAGSRGENPAPRPVPKIWRLGAPVGMSLRGTRRSASFSSRAERRLPGADQRRPPAGEPAVARVQLPTTTSSLDIPSQVPSIVNSAP
jgi:hypothetical protein